MERIIFKKIELWAVVLLLLVIGAGSIYFSSIVKNETEARNNYEMRPAYSWAGDLAFDIASLPDTIRKLTSDEIPLGAAQYERFGNRTGWTHYGAPSPISGYLLFSRIDGDTLTSVIDLVDLSDFSVKHHWIADPDTLLAGASRASKVMDYTQWTKERFRAMHPLMLADGTMVLHGQFSPLVKMDHCSRRIWMEDATNFHHSLNVDAEGNFWAPSLIEPSPVTEVAEFRDDALTEVSPDGKLIFQKSMAQLLDEHDLSYLVFQVFNFSDDPLHMNDIQPVLKDGPYWKKGDLFISMRKRSLVMLYRPSTDEIIWKKQGPWLAQHDVDILDDHRIAIFNNNVKNTGKGGYIEPSSDVRIYDFATDEVTNPYAEAAAAARILAVTNGLMDFTESGHMIVEEDTSGRLLIFGPDHRLTDDYINLAKDGVAYRMGWSSYIDRAKGDAALAAIATQEPCP